MTRSAGYVADIGYRVPDFQLEARLGNTKKKCRAESKQRDIQYFALCKQCTVTQRVSCTNQPNAQLLLFNFTNYILHFSNLEDISSGS
jgi:hypothetical protein